MAASGMTSASVALASSLARCATATVKRARGRQCGGVSDANVNGLPRPEARGALRSFQLAAVVQCCAATTSAAAHGVVPWWEGRVEGNGKEARSERRNADGRWAIGHACKLQLTLPQGQVLNHAGRKLNKHPTCTCTIWSRS